ncbi:hypothetical protein DPMN_140513 [Dreissena polymorpha]|uniref:Uncharacterized protein n=1 Tax=Dreissena polymorpha TaxID=45954 RepID=A0A9D4JLT1_DREPO|nr:hypothetical protein DPMN_140513 [Dreissena polymorpha]
MRQCRRLMSRPIQPQSETAHSAPPMHTVLNAVLTTAMKRTEPILSKNERIGMKYPASKMIGGSK